MSFVVTAYRYFLTSVLLECLLRETLALFQEKVE